jgi:hypothetical protein
MDHAPRPASVGLARAWTMKRPYLAVILWFVILGWAIHLWSVLDAAAWEPD